MAWKAWKYHSVEISAFSVTQILREINFLDFRSAKSAIVTYLEALNFAFYEFLLFWETEIDQTNLFKAP